MDIGIPSKFWPKENGAYEQWADPTARRTNPEYLNKTTQHLRTI